LNAEPEQNISAFLSERIEAGDFPSAVYLIASGGRVEFADALGYSVREPETLPASLETIYDMASLTKPLVTMVLVAQCLERSEIALDDSVSTYLPEFDRADKRRITIAELLTHTSGLPAWRPLYLTTGGDPSRTLNTIVEEPLEALPGSHVRYSDLGFITVGFLLERLRGARLADLAESEIFTPLELRRTFFNPPEAMRREIAASERGNAYEREMSEQTGPVDARVLRDRVIWGEVHDGNAFFLGGVAGHAGLFSTAEETLRLATQFIPTQTKILRPETCSLFRTNMTAGLEEARSPGWQLAATKDSTAGPSLPPDAFGHTGFAGTSCWIDAARERVFILLTNRTHAHSLPFVNMNSVRRKFHTLAVAAM
jgi:CubicO group peptidase (beta-lactamase class C family)